MELSNPALMGKNPKTKTKYVEYVTTYQAIEPNGHVYAETTNIFDFVEYVDEFKGNAGPQVLQIKRITTKVTRQEIREKKWTKEAFYAWLQKK